MGRRQRFWGLLTSAVALACLAPSGAAAERFITNPSLTTGFTLQGSHGYTISVRATGHKYVTLTASRGLSAASYKVRGQASSRRIVANFGSLGMVSVRFDGSAVRNEKRNKRRFSCDKPRPIQQRGAFTGVIRFAGEHGFTTVDSRRAKGEFLRSFRRVCRRAPARDRTLPLHALRAKRKVEILENTILGRSGRDSRRTEFIVSEFELSLGQKQSDRIGLSVYGVSTQETAGAVGIQRFHFSLGDRKQLQTTQLGADPVKATVALPKPFFGKAKFRQTAAEAPSWTGNLGTRLPGTEALPLTGPGFKVALCQAAHEKRLLDCERNAFRSHLASTARTLLQGSGSHSQAFWDARLSWSR
jgi:hypothetical protein